MTSFSESQSQFSQHHFTVVEMDLPVVENGCTISGAPGYGTPLSCDQPSNAIRTYKFTTTDAPLLPESGIHRVIQNISETPSELRSGKGLGSRGVGSVTFIDFIDDPNKDAPAVDHVVVKSGTYFGKLDARQVFENKALRIKNYRVEADGTIDLQTGAETRHYIMESFSSTRNGLWTVRLKDELSRVNVGDTVWPLPLEGALREDIDSSVTTIPVDASVTYVTGDTIRIGDEFMKVTGVSDIGLSTAELTVQTRGDDIDYTFTLSTTTADDHVTNDEIFVCEVIDNERLDDLLERILLDIGIPAARIPKADWTEEVDEWHFLTRVNTLWIESEDTSSVLEKILTYFLMDMWFDPVAREVRLSAVSVWKESGDMLTEGDEIDFESISDTRAEDLRSTRAYVVYDKPALATSESIENYKKASLFTRTELEVDVLFGEPKTKRFDFSSIISKDAADLLVQRWVSRYIDPFRYSWITQEKKRTFEVGDIVDLTTSITVGFNGLPSTATRAQITGIKPRYTTMGREYDVRALAYEPVFASGTEIVITGTVFDVNLFVQYAGAPSVPVIMTFIFDGALSGSTSSSIQSVKAGAFATGSKIIIILANGADLQAKGGIGGKGAFSIFVPGKVDTRGVPDNGGHGAIVYDAQGIDTDIYFSGTTVSTNYPTADGFLRAPGGGAGAFDASEGISGDGGGGGAGRSIGEGGDFGDTGGQAGIGVHGDPGTEVGTGGTFGGGAWGCPGDNNNAFGGLSGSGIIDGGATVRLFGETALRYINGNGNHNPFPVDNSVVQLIMPENTFLSADLSIRDSIASIFNLSESGAWTAIDLDHSEEFWVASSITAAADTSTQTLLDISGQGVLTQIVMPGLSGNGRITITITIDGIQESCISEIMTGTDPRFCLGDLRIHDIDAATVGAITIGGSFDSGFDSTIKGYMPNPPQTASVGRVGIVFRTALKITFQPTIAITATAEANKAVACYTTYIPKGLVS